jgi:hypothetical protein
MLLHADRQIGLNASPHHNVELFRREEAFRVV